MHVRQRQFRFVPVTVDESRRLVAGEEYRPAGRPKRVLWFNRQNGALIAQNCARIVQFPTFTPLGVISVHRGFRLTV